ncbi:hypothetical protein CHS0354_014412 [Potamilus streckersoni]|uniref:Fibrinogen C-terminal domain-containing protein n=1 Tax=Potamilus streckersoni TaxID=2493646 RepID=A0AAE0S9L5_9BIVA|nr:hypothetical protein CHS0354_014412 [Potamilus streckersoni]
MFYIIVLFHLPTIIGLTYNSGTPCNCNPVFYIGEHAVNKSNTNPIVTVTTQLFHDQVKNIFENISNVFLEYQERKNIRCLDDVLNKTLPRDCLDIQLMGHNTTGIYKIYPTGTMGFSVQCDMDTDGGGWTVFQRRVDGTVNFARGWTEYQVGFGNLKGEFWLGNQQLHLLTTQGWYELRVDMRQTNGHRFYAAYNVFSVESPKDRYRLFADGYSGSGGDSLSSQSGYQFSTIDRDNDALSASCASLYQGGWWYSACHRSNLNGIYGSKEYGKGLNWHSTTGFYESLSFSEMKTRRWISK